MTMHKTMPASEIVAMLNNRWWLTAKLVDNTIFVETNPAGINDDLDQFSRYTNTLGRFLGNGGWNLHSMENQVANMAITPQRWTVQFYSASGEYWYNFEELTSMEEAVEWCFWYYENAPTSHPNQVWQARIVRS